MFGRLEIRLAVLADVSFLAFDVLERVESFLTVRTNEFVGIRLELSPRCDVATR
jgi:hypothetical protein